MKTKRLLAVLFSAALIGQITAANSDFIVTPDAFAVPASGNDDGTGDINSDGLVDVSDLTELSLALLGDTELTPEQQKAADVDGDGAVKLTDLAKYKQYLSKQIMYLAPDKETPESEIHEITGYEIFSADYPAPFNEALTVSSEEELKANIDNAVHFYATYDKWTEYNSLDVDFEKEVLVVINDNNSCNGEKQTITGVTVDSEGKIIVHIKDMHRRIQTALASSSCIFLKIPRSELPEGKNITAEADKIHFSDLMEITSECPSYDFVSAFYDEEIYFNQPLNNVIDSSEKFSELNRVVYEDSSNVIRLYDSISENIELSDEFFGENILLASTLIEGSGAVNKSSAVFIGAGGRISKALKREEPKNGADTEIKAWTLITVVPRSVIARAEELYENETDLSKFNGVIIDMKTDDMWIPEKVIFSH